MRKFYDSFDYASYIMFTAAILCAILTYSAFSLESFEQPGAKVGFYLIYLDVIVILTIIYTITRKFFNLYYAQKQGLSGSRFHVKLVSIFSLLTIIPSVIMSIFAIIFFHGGMDAWFTQKNRTVLTESLRVANAYLNEHRELIKDDAVAVAKMLETKLPILPNDLALRSKFLKNMLRLRGLSEGILFDKEFNILARTDFSFSLEFQKIDNKIMEETLAKEVILLNINDKKHIFALTVLDFQEQMFLLVKKPIDDKVIKHLENTNSAVQEYFNAQNQRQNLEISFALLFLLAAILLVFSAIGIAVNIASKIVTPISSLINTAEKIRDGNLDSRVPLNENYDEINILNKTFNEMADRLQEQHWDLVKINKDLDYRMQFTENVLYNISSGVLGIDKFMRTYISNESVKQILNISNNSKITESFPEIIPLFEKAKFNCNKVIEDNISLKVHGSELLLLVRVIYDPKKLNGFVITIDDLTEISLAQRKAAWADVARSVAHEIKNPLTPIKLAAERIEKKYLAIITDDNEKNIFQNLIGTIVKHSDNIKRLVDEFSMFARLPEPIKTKNDIVLICKSSILFSQNTYNWLKFSFHTNIDQLTINCDENLIRQVLNNLLKNSVNAIKYAIRNGMNITEPSVTLKVERLQSANVSIKIMDNGPGFPEEYRKKIMQPYFSLTPNGTGLGLVISKKIVTDHGGKIELWNDTETGGAVVEFVLPC